MQRKKQASPGWGHAEYKAMNAKKEGVMGRVVNNVDHCAEVDEDGS